MEVGLCFCRLLQHLEALLFLLLGLHVQGMQTFICLQLGLGLGLLERS